jgi:rhodanese-related sulfurtransferase
MIWMIVLTTMALTVSGCGEPTATDVREISQEEFIASPPADGLILDVRTPAEFEAGHVPNAVNIPHDELAGRLEELGIEKDQPIVVYCKVGGRAKKASSVLLTAGYGQVLHLTGDMDGWRASGRPVEQ